MWPIRGPASHWCPLFSYIKTQVEYYSFCLPYTQKHFQEGHLSHFPVQTVGWNLGKKLVFQAHYKSDISFKTIIGLLFLCQQGLICVLLHIFPLFDDSPYNSINAAMHMNLGGVTFLFVWLQWEDILPSTHSLNENKVLFLVLLTTIVLFKLSFSLAHCFEFGC